MDDTASWRDEFVAMLRLGVPLALTQLAQIAINTTDVMFMGRLSAEALAAGGLAMGVLFPLLYFGVGVMSVTAPVVAQAVGRRDIRDARRAVRQALWLALLVALPAMLVLTQAETLLRLLGQDAGVARAAHAYLQAMLWGLPAVLGFTVLRGFIAAFSRTRAVLIISVLGVVANALLCWALMFGTLGLPRLELVGAGIAASLVNWLMFLLLGGHILLDRTFRRYHLLGRWWRVDWSHLVSLARLGLPVGLTLVMETGIFGAAALVMGALGTAELAGHQIALQLAAITFMVPLGIGQAATVRVGLAVGRRDLTGMRRAGWSALMLGCLFMAGTALLFWLAPGPLVGLFLRAEDEAGRMAMDLAMVYLGIAGLFQLVDGAQVVGQGALRGMRDTAGPMLIAGGGYWLIGFPVCAWLGLYTDWRGAGVWTGLALGLAVVAVALVWRFHRLSRHLPPEAAAM